MTLQTYLIRLAVPVVLGAGGFALNLAYLNQAVRPRSYLAVNQALRPGDELGDSALEVVELPGDAAARRTDLCSVERRGEVVGRRVVRTIEAGNLLFTSDLDSGTERRAIPSGSRLVYVDMSKLTHEPSRLEHGAQVVFLVRADDSDPSRPPTLGPFSVFTEREWSNEARNRNGAGSLALLVRDDDPQGEALRTAIRNDLLRGLELRGE